MLCKRRDLYRAIRRRSYDKYSQSPNNDRASRPTHSGNRRYPQCPRIAGGKKESSARPPTLRRNRFERRASISAVYSFRTRTHAASRRVIPWERRSRASRNIREGRSEETRDREKPERLDTSRGR